MSKVIVPLDGSTLPGDFEVLLKVRSEHTNGVMSVIEETFQSGRTPTRTTSGFAFCPVGVALWSATS